MTEDKFTPTEDLVMEVLAARYRLGEQIWVFNTKVMPAIRRLTSKGLVNHKSGIVENSELVWLTDEGRNMYLSNAYVPPILQDK